jgi:hypothetical protein
LCERYACSRYPLSSIGEVATLVLALLATLQSRIWHDEDVVSAVLSLQMRLKKRGPKGVVAVEMDGRTLYVQGALPRQDALLAAFSCLAPDLGRRLADPGKGYSELGPDANI